MDDAYFGTPVAATARAAQPAAVAPGWYADPHVPSQLRWWDGISWTQHAHPTVPVQPMPVGYQWGAPPPRDRSMEALLPVNRSGLSIAAGYAGLFSILLIGAPIALALGVAALVDLQHKPDVGGRGRAWFGVIAGAVGTICLLIVIAG